MGTEQPYNIANALYNTLDATKHEIRLILLQPGQVTNDIDASFFWSIWTKTFLNMKRCLTNGGFQALIDSESNSVANITLFVRICGGH
jgi:hypothetical protein